MFKKGHPFYGDLSKPNYFKKGNVPWNNGIGHKCNECGKRVNNKSATLCWECWKRKPKVVWNKGKKMPFETILKFRESHLGQKAWNKGKGKERVYHYYPNRFFHLEFREKIKQRDNYECQNCGVSEEEHIVVFGHGLNLHHIDYNKENCEESNVISVCRACNARANHNREYWEGFFSNRISESNNVKTQNKA